MNYHFCQFGMSFSVLFLILIRIRVNAVIAIMVAPMKDKWKPLFSASICGIPESIKMPDSAVDQATRIASPSADPI